MLDRQARFAQAVAELGRHAARLAQEDDSDVHLSRAAIERALRAAEDLAAAAREQAAPAESYLAAARAVERVTASLAARKPGRLAVVLSVDVDETAGAPA